MKQFWHWLTNIWGKTTTVLLALALSFEAALHDPNLSVVLENFKWASSVIGWIGVFVIFARLVSPKGGNVVR